MGLIITRRPQEVLCIGSNVRIRVIRIKGGQAALHVDAPANISVDREEIRSRRERDDPKFNPGEVK